MGRIGKPGLAGLLVSVALLAGACLNPSRTDQASRLTTPSSGARADKPCLREVGPARPVRNRTAAGAVLARVVMGRVRSGIAFAHGRGGDLCEWLPYARRFARQGYRVLAFDFAGFGDSRPGSGADARLDTDVVAAAGQLRRLGAEKIVLVGSSMGGHGGAGGGDPDRPPVAGVISLSGPRAFGAVHAWRAMPRLRVPVLLVAAADDEPFAGAARAMYHRTGAAEGHRRGATVHHDPGTVLRERGAP